MSKTARLYRDTRTANAASSNLDKLNDDLQDVTRIMTKNMEELLWRGDSLDREYLSFVSVSIPDQLSVQECRIYQHRYAQSQKNTVKLQEI
jgi:hypothetical protein